MQIHEENLVSQGHVAGKGGGILINFSDHYDYSSLIQRLSSPLNAKEDGQALGYLAGTVWSGNAIVLCVPIVI